MKTDKENNLIWLSQVHSNTGTATFCRNQCESFYKLGYFDNIQILPDPYVPTKLDNPVLQKMIETKLDIRKSTVIQVMWPERWYATIAKRPKWFIGYNAIEGTKIPYNWVQIMNDDDVDLVLTMSSAMKRMFVENGVKKRKLFALGHGVNPVIFKPKENDKTTRFQKPYTFLYVNGWRTSIGRNDRKGPEILLDAWVKGNFVNNPKYHLYMKVNMVYEQKRDYFKDIKQKVGYDVSKWTNFTFDTTDYPVQELVKIYQNADCFVAPTKGEGWGITIQEAMACGLPVIVPNNPYAGYMDFCNKKNSLLIEIEREEEVDSRLMGHFYSGSKWHIASTDDLIHTMRWCVQYPQEAKKIGMRGMKEVVTYWTWDDASDRLIEELKRRKMYYDKAFKI